MDTENDKEDAEDYKWIDWILSSAKPTKMVYMFLIEKQFEAPNPKVNRWNME